MGYPSLQGKMEFDSVADAVRMLDRMVVELKFAEEHFRDILSLLEMLPVKRRGHYQRDLMVAALTREADKIADTLSVFGFADARVTERP